MSLINKEIYKSLKFKTMERSRRAKLEHFCELCPGGGSFLDVGVSRETGAGRRPLMNLFLKTFRYRPEDYTGLGVQDLTGMDKLYPGKRFVQYSGGIFPFADNEFDWIWCNAVIEHVGRDDAQVQFVNEMLRVSRNVFFTTPNKYFPVDSHTNVFFLHWNSKYFYKWCKNHKPNWTKDNHYLFSLKRLNSIMEKSNAGSYQIYKNRLLGMVMTFTIVCSS